MKLINELQERWKAIFLERESVEKRADELAEDMQELEVALAALQGLHSQRADAEPDLFEDEKAEASEHLADDHPLPAAADDVVIEIEASNQSESCVSSLGAETGLQPSPGGVEESPDQFEEEAERAAAIELTADVMPEAGLHEEAPALNADMHDEREQPVEPGDGYAPVTDAWIETTPGTLAEYTPPTNPEADALAKAHDYYDPKAVADRERNAGMARLFSYNPFHKPKVDA